MAKSPVTVGGEYKESDDHIPNPTDITTQFNTSGVGAHHRIEEVAPIFEVDKVTTAQEITAALDDKDDTVPASRVLLPDPLGDNETAKKNIEAAAKARVKQGATLQGPGPAEREAALEGEEGHKAAVRQEQSNSVVGDPADAGGHVDAAGQPSSNVEKGTESSSSSGSSSSSSTAKKAASSSNK